MQSKECTNEITKNKGLQLAEKFQFTKIFPCLVSQDTILEDSIFMEKDPSIYKEWKHFCQCSSTNCSICSKKTCIILMKQDYLFVKNQKVPIIHGTKRCKDRITIGVATNTIGSDKLSLLIHWKEQKTKMLW